MLSHPGVRTVLLFEGVNDIKAHTGVTAGDLIDGYRRIIGRAHAAGVCVVGATVGPFKGWYEWDAAAESVRQEVNAFVRTGGEFDAVADFDRCPAQPLRPRADPAVLRQRRSPAPQRRRMNALADAVPVDGLSCDRRAQE